MFKKPFYILIYDILLVTGSFLLMTWLRPVDAKYMLRYIEPFIIFLSIWLAASFSFKKYRNLREKSLRKITWDILSANLVAISICAIVIYGFRIDYFSRTMVFGTVALANVFELIGGFLVYNIAHATEEYIKPPLVTTTNYKTQKEFFAEGQKYEPYGKHEEKLKRQFVESCGQEAFEIIKENIDPFYPKTLVLSTVTQFNVDKQPDEFFENIINIKNINDIRRINKFLRAINSKLPFGGMFIGCAETKTIRKMRIMKGYPPLINYFVYLIDFIFSRILPKFRMTQGIYFFLTKGQNRVLTKAEILGRLYYCGFELVREIYSPEKYFFVVHKITPPHRTPHSHYGLFIRLRRVAKNKKLITVYKLRTMHAYSEYIQDLIYSRHGTADGDKARNDYRITTAGKIFRRLWLDEFPMLLNLLKREIKIVGVRPLSKSKFSMYPKNMQDKRTRCKPGLIPPFYVDMPNSFEELVASEEKYLDQYFKHPLKTDFKYFFKALYNILIKQARSK